MQFFTLLVASMASVAIANPLSLEQFLESRSDVEARQDCCACINWDGSDICIDCTTNPCPVIAIHKLAL